MYIYTEDHLLVPTYKSDLRQAEVVERATDEIIQILPLHPMVILQLLGPLCSADEMRIDDQQIGVLGALVNSQDAFARAIPVPSHHDRATELLEVGLNNGHLVPQRPATWNVYDFTENLVQMIQH